MARLDIAQNCSWGTCKNRTRDSSGYCHAHANFRGANSIDPHAGILRGVPDAMLTVLPPDSGTMPDSVLEYLSPWAARDETGAAQGMIGAMEPTSSADGNWMARVPMGWINSGAATGLTVWSDPSRSDIGMITSESESAIREAAKHAWFHSRPDLWTKLGVNLPDAITSCPALGSGDVIVDRVTFTSPNPDNRARGFTVTSRIAVVQERNNEGWLRAIPTGEVTHSLGGEELRWEELAPTSDEPLALPDDPLDELEGLTRDNVSTLLKFLDRDCLDAGAKGIFTPTGRAEPWAR